VNLSANTALCDDPDAPRTISMQHDALHDGSPVSWPKKRRKFCQSPAERVKRQGVKRISQNSRATSIAALGYAAPTGAPPPTLSM
jgi:hypothetical protein